MKGPRQAKDPKKTIARLLSYLKKYRTTMIIVILCLVLSAGAMALSAASLGTLVGLLGCTTFVGIQCEADIALFVGLADRRATAAFGFVTIALGGSRPCVVEQIKVFFIYIRAYTFDPYGHGVWTMCP